MLKYILFLLLIFIVSSKNLILFQDQYYDAFRLLKIKKKKIFKLYLLMIPLFIIDLIFNNYYFMIGSLVLSILLYTTKKLDFLNLKFTFRIKRILIINLLLNLLLLQCINKYYIFFTFILVILNIFTLILSNYIDSLFRLIIDKYYINKLKIKLNKIKPIIIGITGSYAKTSTKNYLDSILKLKYNTLKTKGNINTFRGIISYLNKNLNDNHEVIILEIGIDKKKGMNKFLKVFNFDYAFLTGIEKCHLATFKSIDNIINEKMKLIKNSKVSFINIDNKYLKEVDYNTYSLNDLEYLYFDNRTHFKLKNINKEFITNIIGEHHILNIIGVIKFLKYLNFTDELIYQGVMSLKSEKHRFELIKKDNMIFIDDGYNSNETSFKLAVDNLKYFDKDKVIITPGVIELGKENEMINYNLGLYMLNKFKEIILIGKNSLSLEKAFLDNNYNDYKYFLTYKEGMKYILNKYSDALVLIENDLVNNYLD